MKLCVPVRVAVVSLMAAYGRPAFAAQTDISISTTAAPPTPRILGATIIGSTPGSPFLYTISATGQAPLTFAATGLPAGLVDCGKLGNDFRERRRRPGPIPST